MLFKGKGFTFKAIKPLNMKSSILLAALLITLTSGAQLRLSSVFSDHMVMQRDRSNAIWGWTDPGKEVKVECKGKTYPTYADAQGRWTVYLEPIQAGETIQLNVVSGEKSLQVKDIIGGEVWLCSGQSNMEWRMDMLHGTYDQEMQTARHPQIRFMTVNKSLATTPVEDADIQTPWAAIEPGTTGQCSAVAYWFAKKLHQELKVPIGLVVTSWGGTPAEAWTSYEGLYSFPHYLDIYQNKIRPLDLNGLSQKKKELFQQFTEQIQASAETVRAAMQPGYADDQWKETTVPGPWEEKGHPNLDGVVAYRLSFTVREADAGKSAVLNMPAIDDIDSTFINGVFLGTTAIWDKPRTYSIPAGVLKAGTNVLAVRVQDNQGGGGFASVPALFYVKLGDQQIPLSGKARYKIFAELKDITSGYGAIEYQPSVLYNAMIAPLMPLQFNGVIWYQGESNANTPQQSVEYRNLFPALIRSWRNKAGRDFPFLFVQLSSFGPVKQQPGESNWGLLRESQTQTLALPNTGMAVSIDVGDPGDIHPVRKKEVGERLAGEALRIAYQQRNRVSRGPMAGPIQFQGNKVIISFTSTGKGLVAKGGPLRSFAVAGADQKFYWAQGTIQGNQVILTCPQVSKPVAVRYAWADSPIDANLFNKEGWPAVPFRSDTW